MISRRQFIQRVGLLVGILLTPLGRLVRRYSQEPAEEEPPGDWQSFEDPEGLFSLMYPPDWETRIRIMQPSPSKAPEAILRRQSFFGEEGLLDVDLWDACGKGFQDWLSWYEITRLPFSESICKGIVSNLPAIGFIEGGQGGVTVFLSDDRMVYRLRYLVTQAADSVEIFRHLLDNFSLSEKSPVNVDFPEEFWSEARVAAEVSQLSILTSTCCGYTQSYNRFPCCNPPGNCTWWIYYRYGYVPFWGDAGTWWSQVPDYWDWMRSTTPARGKNIAWWSSLSKPNLGHVAHVWDYTGGSTINFNQMKCRLSCVTYEYGVDLNNPDGYIWKLDIH